MGNGFSTEQMLEFIWEDVKETKKKLEHIIENGCPVGKTYCGDMEEIKRWRDKMTNRFIAMLLSIIGCLLVGGYSLHLTLLKP